MTFAGLATIVLTALIISGCLYSVYSIFCVASFFGKDRFRGGAGDVPVSILKPVKGSDPEFRDNMETFCRQGYPQYEVLIGFNAGDADAAGLARELTEQDAGLRPRIVPNHSGRGLNQKVSNLQGLVEAAEYSLLAISDSDMRVGRDYLGTIVGEYLGEDNVGLVTCLYKISGPSSPGAALESLTIALDFIPSVLVAQRLEGITFGLGASMLLSKKAIADIGGLAPISDYLADDYQIGNRLWKKGYKIVLSQYVMEDVAGSMSIQEYLTHQLRWARTYRASRPKGFLGYGITHIFAFSVFLLVLQGGSAYSLSMLCSALGLRLWLAYVVYRKVVRSKGWLRWLFLLPIKDVLAFGIWVWSFLGRKVYWRGNYFNVEKGGTIKARTGRN